MFELIHKYSMGNGRKSRQFQNLRSAIVKYHDPLIKYDIGGSTLLLPLSHNLPYFLARYPTYSGNLVRLGIFLRREFSRLIMIDIGANVGDSYHLVQAQPGDAYLLIEGDPEFFAILMRNTPSDSGVVQVQTLISDSRVNTRARVETKSGNARIVNTPSNGSETVTYDTIDNLIQSYPTFRSANLLKSDIEGYDTRALLGSLELIQTARPILFFEHYPELLEAADTDPCSIFAVLQKTGYRQAIFYDNLGSLLCTANMDDRQLLESLIFYAKQKSSYYDVCCFPEVHQHLQNKFLLEEHAYYSSL